jgi:hypothetical protein
MATLGAYLAIMDPSYTTKKMSNFDKIEYIKSKWPLILSIYRHKLDEINYITHFILA